MSTPTEPGKDATPEEIQADIEATRERLVENVEALAAKADVKGQAKEKAAELKEQAAEKAGEAKEQVTTTVQRLPRPAQVAIPVALLTLIIAIIVGSRRRSRS